MELSMPKNHKAGCFTNKKRKCFIKGIFSLADLEQE
jgi:hypothetical protein